VKLTHSKLAKALGFSRQYVGKLVQKEMPMTSVKAAKEWQTAHCPNAGIRTGNQGATK
jgi:YesN/AraC family two-component response regulator